MKTFKQIDSNTIQSHETHADGSYTSGVVIRGRMKKDSDGKEYEPWQKLINDNNEDVVWLTAKEFADLKKPKKKQQSKQDALFEELVLVIKDIVSGDTTLQVTQALDAFNDKVKKAK